MNESVKVALDEIGELLQQAQRNRQLQRVSVEQIRIIVVSHQVNLYKEAPEALEAFYRDHLTYCLQDKVLSEHETENLAHLKLILGLNDQTVERIHQEVVQAIYQESVEAAVADGRLDEAEQRFLNKLQYDLRLPDEIAQSIYAEEAREYLNRYYQYAINDERLSPDEEHELNAIARSLGVDIDLNERTQSALNKYRLYWVIENGRLPELDVPIDLRRGESCYLAVDMQWYEHLHKTLSERIGSVRFFKPDYQRPAMLDALPLAEGEWQLIDSGQAYLTNERLVLVGADEQVEIDLTRILDFKMYRNGIEVICRSGSSPFLAFDKGVDIFLVLLGRAIRDLE